MGSSTVQSPPRTRRLDSTAPLSQHEPAVKQLAPLLFLLLASSSAIRPAIAQEAAAAVAPEKPLAPKAQLARLELRGSESELDFYWKPAKAGPGSFALVMPTWGGNRVVMPSSSSLEWLCKGGCAADLPVGKHQIGLGLDDQVA